MMTIQQQIITIAIMSGVTVVLRILPFLVFSDKRPVPKFIDYLGKALPAAIFGMLVVYCLKDVHFVSGTYHGLPEIIALAATIGVHLWKRQLLLSVAVGTVCYMILVQLVFV